jgi:hypothetical protein
MTRAKARIEQATSGQIGQPAACMIENKWTLHADEMPRNYHPRSKSTSPTESVDNFVSNWPVKYRQAALGLACDRSMTN